MRTIILLSLMVAPLCADQRCILQNGNVGGDYSFLHTGTGGGPAFGGVTGPVAALGRITLDGSGSLRGTVSLSFNGTVTRGIPFSGSYSINSDCTGTLTFFGSSVHFDIVITPDGRQITMLQTDTGTTISGSAIRLDRKD